MYHFWVLLHLRLAHSKLNLIFKGSVTSEQMKLNFVQTWIEQNTDRLHKICETFKKFIKNFY